MKRLYQVSITILKVIEVDEDEVRELCEIPEDEEISEEVFNDWIQSKIDDYIEEDNMCYDVNDIEFDRSIP